MAQNSTRMIATATPAAQSDKERVRNGVPAWRWRRLIHQRLNPLHSARAGKPRLRWLKRWRLIAARRLATSEATC